MCKFPGTHSPNSLGSGFDTFSFTIFTWTGPRAFPPACGNSVAQRCASLRSTPHLAEPYLYTRKPNVVCRPGLQVLGFLQRRILQLEALYVVLSWGSPGTLGYPYLGKLPCILGTCIMHSKLPSENGIGPGISNLALSLILKTPPVNPKLQTLRATPNA